MQVTDILKPKQRKAKASAPRKAMAGPAPEKAGEISGKPRKVATAATSKATITRKAIADAVQQYMSTNYGGLIALSALASSPELQAMLAEIDRNLDASEQCTARLLAAQD